MLKLFNAPFNYKFVFNKVTIIEIYKKENKKNFILEKTLEECENIIS